MILTEHMYEYIIVFVNIKKREKKSGVGAPYGLNFSQHQKQNGKFHMPYLLLHIYFYFSRQ